ncbi:MAG: VOC family protein [Deltaproteobacteria bacterium]|nr:VOC family protein [Deltaproteobacteria bacterium]
MLDVDNDGLIHSGASLSKIHHLALGAHDVAGVAAFYRDTFGLAEIARHPDAAGKLRSIWLNVGGGATLMIERTDDKARRVLGVGLGPFLLAFRVAPGERVAFERRLADMGVPVEANTDFSLYFRDPEGNRVAVSHYPQEGVEPQTGLMV